MIVIYIFFIYGLSFFALGFGTLLKPKKDSAFDLAGAFRLVAVFGILHGINEWLGMFVFIKPSVALEAALKVIGTMTLPASFFFLFHFGIKIVSRDWRKSRRGLLKITPAALFALWAAITLASSRKFIDGEIWARYLLGAPSIFLASYAFIRQAREFGDEKTAIFRFHAKLLAGAFGFYGLFAGLVVPAAGFFPADVLNVALFMGKVGVPVQAFRALCAVVAASSGIRLLDLFEWETRSRLARHNDELAKINELLKVESAQLKSAHEFAKLILDSMRDAVAIIDLNDLKIVSANKAFLEEYGYSNESEVVGRVCHVVTHNRPEGCWEAEHPCPLEHMIVNGEYSAVEHVHYNRQGKKILVEVSACPIRDPNGDIRLAIHTARNITALVRLKDELKDFLDNASDLIQSVGSDGRFLFVNRAWKEVLGYSDEDLRGLTVFDVIHPLERQHCMEKFSGLMAGEAVGCVETVFLTRDGRSISVEGNVNIRQGDGVSVATRGIFRDITKRKEMEENLNRLATIDQLTGAYNRYRLGEILKEEVPRARRYKRPLCLLMIDIDHFKTVNDTFGHHAGDIVLKTLSELVKGHLRQTDYWGRWGGEEFVLIAPETDASGAMGAAGKIRKLVEDHRFETVGKVTISCGIAECGEADTIDTLFRKVDAALYRAKEKGRNRVEI